MNSRRDFSHAPAVRRRATVAVRVLLAALGFASRVKAGNIFDDNWTPKATKPVAAEGPVIQICPVGDGSIEWYMECNKTMFHGSKDILVKGAGPKSHALGLAVWNSDATIARAEVLEVRGVGKALRE